MQTKKRRIKCSIQPKIKRVTCEVFSRPVGYLRTVVGWNDAKKQEFTDRKNYSV